MRVTPALMSLGEKDVLLLVSLKSTECQQVSRRAWSALGGPQSSSRARKPEMARWPACGQKNDITSVVSPVPVPVHRDINHKCVGGLLVGEAATSPLLSRGSPPLIARTKIKNG